MPRLLYILALLAIVDATVGASALAAFEDCSEGCPDEGAGGACPPTCDSCACCAHPLRSLTAGRTPIATTPPPVRVHSHTSTDSSPPSPEPHDIFHVPKRVLV